MLMTTLSAWMLAGQIQLKTVTGANEKCPRTSFWLIFLELLVTFPPAPGKPVPGYSSQFSVQLLRDKTWGFTSPNPAPGTQIVNTAALN